MTEPAELLFIELGTLDPRAQNRVLDCAFCVHRLQREPKTVRLVALCKTHEKDLGR